MTEQEYLVVERLTLLKCASTAIGNAIVHLDTADRARMGMVLRSLDAQIAADSEAVQKSVRPAETGDTP